MSSKRNMSQKQLLTFRLIAWLYYRITSWLRWAHEKVTETEVYQWAKRIKLDVKAKMAAWIKKIKHGT